MQEKTRQNLAKIVIIFLGFLIPSFIFLGVLQGPIYSASSDTINLQGKIVRNDVGHEGLNISTGSPACVVSGDGNDTCDFRVRYYDAPTAGNLLLTEQFSDVEIGQYVGVFNVSLGSDPAPSAGVYTSLSSLIQGESDVYVEVGFDPSGLSTYTEVFSRMPLEATGYAIRAKYADTASGASEVAWSGLKNPTADVSLQHSTYTTLFNWATGTGTDNLFSLTSDASSNGTGALMNIQTGVGSSLIPLRVRAGNTEAIYVNSSGNVGIGTIAPAGSLGDLTVYGGDIFLGSLLTQITADASYLYFNAPDGTTRLHLGASGIDNRVIFTLQDSAGGAKLQVRDSGTAEVAYINSDGGAYFAGNIGIGTASPTSLLSVGSTSQFQINTSGDIVKLKNLTYSWPSAHTTDGFLKNDGLGNLTWSTITGLGGVTGTGVGGQATFWTDTSTISGDNAFWWDNTNKRLGIGTTTPSTQLHTTGDVRFAGLVTDTQTTAVMADTGGNLSTRVLGLLAFEDTAPGDNWGTQVVQTNTTLTGDGTLTALLGINLANANTWIASQTFSASTYFPGSGIWDSTGNLGIGTISPLEKLTLASASNLATEMATPGAPTLTCNTTGGTLADGTYYYKIVASDGVGTTVAGTQGSCTITGGSGAGSVSISWSEVTGASSYRIYGRDTNFGQYWTSSSTSYTDTGTLGTTGTPPTVTTAYVNKLTASGNSWLLGGSVGVGTASASYKFHVSGSSTSLVNLGDTVYVDSANNRVGIGVVEPSSKLTVYGSSTETDIGGFEVGMRIANTDTTTNNWQSIVFGDTAKAGIEVKNVDHTNDYGDIAFTTRASDGWLPRMYIKSSGYVGIGTDNPLAKLHVKGNQIRLKNEADADLGVILDSGSTTTYRDVIYFRDRGTDIFGLEKTATNALQLYDYAVGGISRIFVEAGSNSGISMRTMGTGDFSFINSTNTRVTITDTGYMGIGTTDPSNLLSVGSTSQFQVNTSGDIVKLKNLTYSWPTSHTTNGFLHNDGSGNLTWIGAGGVAGSGTAGQAAFWTGTSTISGDNAFWWDNTNKRLGIGTSRPGYSVDLGDGKDIRTGEEFRTAADEASCPIWKDCDGDGYTGGAGDCDESCSTCYVSSSSVTYSPDGKDQDCDMVVDNSDALSAYVYCNSSSAMYPPSLSACQYQCDAVYGYGNTTAHLGLQRTTCACGSTDYFCGGYWCWSTTSSTYTCYTYCQCKGTSYR